MNYSMQMSRSPSVQEIRANDEHTPITRCCQNCQPPSIGHFCLSHVRGTIEVGPVLHPVPLPNVMSTELLSEPDK